MLAYRPNGDIIWLEFHAAQAPRGRLLSTLKQPKNPIYNLSQSSKTGEIAFDVSSRVHEYGGGDFAVTKDFLWFTHQANTIIRYDFKTKRHTRFFTHSNKRFANFVEIEKSLICIEEDHSNPKKEPQNRIVCFDEDANASIFIEGADFYADLVYCPYTQRLAWLQWNHPHMPWDMAECWVGDIISSKNGVNIANAHKIAGGQHHDKNSHYPSSACFQPCFDPQGTLYFVDDKMGYWQLYSENHLDHPIAPFDSDTGMPLWQLGMKTYAFLDDLSCIMAVCRTGLWHLEWVDPTQPNPKPIALDLPFSEYQGLTGAKDGVIFTASTQNSHPQIIYLKIHSSHDDPNKKYDWYPVNHHKWQIQPTQSMQVASTFKNQKTKIDQRAFSDKHLSMAQNITFPSLNGQAFAFFYPPHNADFMPLENELPPLIVRCHGGPTGQAVSSFSLKTQFWTNRGFAVLDVNYRGSTGFGRRYREQLKNQWGILDVADACAGAKYLIAQKMVDQNKLIISGSSAGGFSVLAALTFQQIFNAGCSAYGIGYLLDLANST
ncbi:MAG: prolyl oligopeptidase family serine peptidase, partial [Pseudomonadota bacterium]